VLGRPQLATLLARSAGAAGKCQIGRKNRRAGAKPNSQGHVYLLDCRALGRGAKGQSKPANKEGLIQVGLQRFERGHTFGGWEGTHKNGAAARSSLTGARQPLLWTTGKRGLGRGNELLGSLFLVIGYRRKCPVPGFATGVGSNADISAPPLVHGHGAQRVGRRYV
jgi:hypothetical protein